jgi:apolipoprotein N-acyltransferase
MGFVRFRAIGRQFKHPMRWLSFLAGGVPPILVFPGPSLSYVAWFALVPGMVLFLRAPTTREALARGWWFGAAYLIAMLYWMATEIGPGLLLLAAVLGWMWAPFAVATSRLLRPRVSWLSALGAFIVIPSCWLIPEWIRSYQGLGGPWGLYGASQWQHPAVLGLAAVGGVWLVSVALVMANVALTLIIGALRPSLLAAAPAADAVSAQGAAPAQGAPPTQAAAQPPAPVAAGPRSAVPSARRRAALLAAGVAAFAVAAGSGPLAFALTSPFPAVREVTVALVQPGLIHDPVKRVNASEALTASLIRGGSLGGVHPDLIVWGESSVAYDLTVDRTLLSQIEALSSRAGAEVLVSQDSLIPGQGQEKVAVLVSPAGIKGRYVKSRLVPFGEYIPFRQQLGWLTNISKAASSNMIPGTGAHLLMATDRAGRPLPIGVLVCFESAFPDMSRVDADKGAQLIVYQSATSTFQGSWGPDQHASLAALRAAETGRPVVQAALTGDSVAFDARGRQLAWMDQSGHGVVTVRLALPAGTDQTFYDQAGDFVLWTGVAISAIAALVMFARRKGFLGGSAGISSRRTAEYETDTGQPVPSS